MRDAFVVIVTEPGFEQVAEDVQRVGPRNFVFEKAKKTPGGSRAFVAEMQVGDEIGAPRALAANPARRRVQTISAFSMTTSSSGTS